MLRFFISLNFFKIFFEKIFKYLIFKFLKKFNYFGLIKKNVYVLRVKVDLFLLNDFINEIHLLNDINVEMKIYLETLLVSLFKKYILVEFVKIKNNDDFLYLFFIPETKDENKFLLLNKYLKLKICICKKELINNKFF
jgi:hypothetical protein